MPATESTWRSLKRMHVVFGIASLAMLFTTIWMLADDHNRSWKNYQRKFRDIETWTNTSRLEEQDTADYEKTLSDLEKKLEDVRQGPLTPAEQQQIDKFVALGKTKTEAEDDDQARADAQAADKIADDAAQLAKLPDTGKAEDDAAIRSKRRVLRMDLYNRMSDFVSRVK